MTHEMQRAPGGVPDVPRALRVFGDVPQTHGFVRTIAARPPLSPIGVLAALAGALLATATLVTLGASDDPSPWAIAALGALLLVVAWSAAFGAGLLARLGSRPALAELIPFGTTMAIAGTGAATTGLAAQATLSGSSPESITWWPYLLIALVMLVLWVLPGLQGRPAILATGLLAGTWAAAGFVAVQVGSDRYRGDAGMFSAGMTPALFFPSYDSDALRAAALVALGAGLVFLVAAAVLDRVRLPGLGTPLLVAGVVTAAIGSQGVAFDNSVLRALVPLLVAIVMMAIGIAGSRKATTWLGAIAALPLIIQLSVALLGDDPSAGVVAVVVASFGVLILIAALILVTFAPAPRAGAEPDEAPALP